MQTPDEEMTVEIELDDGSVVTCEVITILTVNDKDYIVLFPQGQDTEEEENEVWIYGYSENPDDPDEEPELIYIDDEDEYNAVADAFDAFLEEEEAEEV